MKFEIRGLTQEEVKENWFNDDGSDRKGGTFLGYYDGVKFTSDEFAIEDLKEFYALHIFVNNRLRTHRPKKYNQNIEESLKKDFVMTFGEAIQESFL